MNISPNREWRLTGDSARPCNGAGFGSKQQPCFTSIQTRTGILPEERRADGETRRPGGWFVYRLAFLWATCFMASLGVCSFIMTHYEFTRIGSQRSMYYY